MNKRRSTPVLQTGFLTVEAPDADTLCITRFARDGVDVFGQPLAAKGGYGENQPVKGNGKRTGRGRSEALRRGGFSKEPRRCKG